MKNMISTALAALLALPVLAGPPGRGPGRHAPPPRRAYCAPPPPRRFVRPLPRRPPPPLPPPRPRFEPVVAGVLGLGTLLLAPQYQWVPGHWETVTTVLPDGRAAASAVWVPGRYVRVR